MSDITTPPCALPDSPLARAADGLDACVHCGFCLPACPTYVTLHDENDSPRGRLLLMRRLLDGDIAPDDPDVGTHLDRCLGCRGCETACPSGVPYGELLEATRATLRTHRSTPWIARLVLGVFARPATLAIALAGARLVRATGLSHWLARTLPSRAAFPFAMLASTRPVRRSARPSARVVSAAANGSRGTVTTLTGCVMQGLFAHVHAATDTALRHTGHTLVRAPGQRCCGALHAHAGDLETARELARHNIAAFEQVPDALIAVNSAGCGAMLKEYGHLLHDDPVWAERAAQVARRVRDVSELLADQLAQAPAGTGRGREPVQLGRAADQLAQAPAGTGHGRDAVQPRRVADQRAPAPATRATPALRVAYDPPCHLLHAQRISAQPLAMLRGLPQVELVPLEDADLCCGSAGIYNLVEPDTSDAVLSPKLQHILAARVDVVATGNPGCLMQLGAGLLLAGSETRAVHPVELVAEALGDGRD